MGWIAAGCCTIIAGYVLFKYYTRSASEESARNIPLRSALIPSLRIQQPDSAVGPAPALRAERSPLLPEPPVKLNLPVSKVDQDNVGPDVIIIQSVDEKPVQMEPILESKTRSQPPPPTVSRSPSPSSLKAPSSSAMSAPPRPGNPFIRPPPSAAASLRVPPQKALPNTSMAPTSSIMPPGKQVSRKVILEPGHSPLDWAALTSDPNARLRGKDAPENLIRVTPELLKRQNGRKGKDAWTVYHGKVYNISPYVPFHPGGAGEILRGAGKDSVKLFMEVHPWVNWDGMLSECLVGILVADEDESGASASKSNSLDDMD